MKLTLFICAFFSFILPLLAAPVPGTELEKRVTHKGRGTWFTPGLGNCGGTNNSNDHIVAMSKAFYDANNGGNCYQFLEISWGGKTVKAQMVDSCPGCGENDLDMSPAVFKEFASLDKGVLSGISWHFIAK
ncbi:expansin family protein [Gloeopeniophorella convolvens]|nr:expansin family protein [Gloeopeniophorella convolvens]